jgi:hypothetical protein
MHNTEEDDDGTQDARSPLVTTTQLSDSTFEVTTHRGAGGVPYHVDYYMKVEDGDVSGALDSVAYEAAEQAAEGFHVCVVACSPRRFEHAVGTLLDGEDAAPKALTLTMGYILHMFQNDSVNIDATAVLLDPAADSIVDLLAAPPTHEDEGGEVPQVKQLHYRNKWGLMGTCRTAAINGIEDIATLPSADSVAHVAGPSDDACVVFQFRIRRQQAVNLSNGAHDFDIVQHITFVALPPGPWLRTMGPGVNVSESASPHDAAEALLAALLQRSAGTSSFSSDTLPPPTASPNHDSNSRLTPPARPADSDSASDAVPRRLDASQDDSRSIMISQALAGVVREILAGPTQTWVVVPAASGDLIDHLQYGEALKDFMRIRRCSARVAQPAMAHEAHAVRVAEACRVEAMAAAKAIMRYIPEPAALVDRRTWHIEAVSATGNAYLPDNVVVLELCRASSDREVLSVGELMDAVQPGTPHSDDNPIVVRNHDLVVSAAEEIGTSWLLVRFGRPVASRAPTPMPPSPPECQSCSVEGGTTSTIAPTSIREEHDDLLPRPGPAAAERIGRHHEAKKKVIEDRRAAASRANHESSCSCLVA